MEEISTAVSLMCCRAYKDDRVVKGFCGLTGNSSDEALGCYSDICEALLSSGRTLGEYLFYLAADAENPVMRRYLSDRSQAARGALENDISVLARIASLGADSVVSYLRERFSVPESVKFPMYERGDTLISADNVLGYVEKYGSSVFEKNKAFTFECGKLSPAAYFDPIRLSDLKNYGKQRKLVIENTACLLAGKRAQNALLYGDRGTGKSSTIKAVVNEYPALRVIQVQKSDIGSLGAVYELVKVNPLKFIIFIDDISFGDGEEGYSALKQALEGSVVSMPDNCIIYATTNRRRILKETRSEREGDELHAADARDENMSLADRFGLFITFSTPGKDEYLDIVRQIAADRGLSVDGETLERLAERFALKKCGRSPRTARQFVDILGARTELNFDDDV